MSCEDLEPFVTITRSYGKNYATRHRRDCGVACRSISAPSAGGSTMNESEYKARRRVALNVSNSLSVDWPTMSDHVCMKRWNEHGKAAVNTRLRKMGEPELG